SRRRPIHRTDRQKIARRQGSMSIVNLLTAVRGCYRCRCSHGWGRHPALPPLVAMERLAVPDSRRPEKITAVFLTTVREAGIYRVRNWKYNAGLIPAVPQAVRAYSLRRVGGPPFHLERVPRSRKKTMDGKGRNRE